MLRTLNTANNLPQLLSRAPSVWDSWDPSIDYDTTETPPEHITFVLEARIKERLTNGGEITFIIDNPKQVGKVLDLIKRAS